MLDSFQRSIVEMGKRVGWSAKQRPKAPAPAVDRHDDLRHRRMLLFGGVAAALHVSTRQLHDAAGDVHNISGHLMSIARSESRELASAITGHRFRTDFREPDPTAHWIQSRQGSLRIEPAEHRMSALPYGPNLLVDKVGLVRDGSATFEFATRKRDAEFVFRGQDHNNCYVANLITRDIEGGEPEVNLVVRRRRRGGSRVIASRTIHDLQLARLHVPTVTITMNGDAFTAYWEEGQKVLHSWKDDTYREGLTGVWGPPLQRRAPARQFRLFSVAVNA